METRQINVYEFKELNKDIQEKVLNRFREQNEYDFLEENLTESLKDLLKKNKIKVVNDDLKIHYSLSYCQGDGVCFIGLFKWKKFLIRIKHNFQYYHKRSTDINVLKVDKEGNEEDAEEKDEEAFKNLYYNICDKIEKEGYSEIEVQDSEENLKEIININEYKFFENGEIA